MRAWDFWQNVIGEAPVTGSGVAMLGSVRNRHSWLNDAAGQRLPPVSGWSR